LDQSVAGPFYTYVIDAFVIDAFAPEAGLVFAGFGFGANELNYIEQWSRRDDRISVENKMSLACFPKDDGGCGDIYSVAKRHFDRWSNRNFNNTDKDFEKLYKVAEEMALLCSIKPEKLHAISPRQFEELVASLFKNHGFDV
jgi:hypothetical protein